MQKNIRNLKDPTTTINGRGRWQWLTLLAIALSTIGTVYAADGRQLAQWSVQNVTCTAHEAKFTCDCHHVNQPMQLPHLDGYVFQVEILNCKSLTIEANSLEETKGLRKITFQRVENLVLKKYALAFPRYASNTPLIIEFDQVNFESIESHAINGNIEEISFLGGRIDVIHPFGFTTLKDRALLLKMDRVWVKRIESQAFKKFAVEQMEITNCIFEENVPSKAFYELEVHDTMIIRKVRFREVHTKAFSFKLIAKLIVVDNYFDGVNGEWFEGHIRESVKVMENYFGQTSPIAFKGFTVHRDYVASERLEMRFTNNTVRFPSEPRPLEFNERFSLVIKQLQYENVYPCKDVDVKQKPLVPSTNFFRQHSDSIYFRRENGASSKAATPSPSSSSPSSSRDNQSFVVLNKIIDWDCQPRSYWLYILLAVIALIVILLIVAIVLWFYFAKKRKKQKLNMVLPEPRTYKETQIVYQIENAGLLKTDL